MEEFIRKITGLLARNFPGSEVQFEKASASRIGGLMTWAGFEGQEQAVRQRRLWQVIRASLPAHEQLRVSAILTMTPEEMTSAREE